MRIAILGLGYVGCVTAAYLAEMGHLLFLYDPQESKRDLLAYGRPTILEPGLDEHLREANLTGRIHVCKEEQAAIQESELVLVSVGTPTRTDGTQDLSAVLAVTDSIAGALRGMGTPPVIIYRSTVLPGTTRTLIRRMEEISGLAWGRHFDVLMHPEFLREGTAMEDFARPALCVAGGAADGKGAALLQNLYNDMDQQVTMVELEEAELLKYACNAFHAVKVAFANEIGRIAESVEADPKRVMTVFCKDLRQNISTAYLRPGLPYGGSCLPKDIEALALLDGAGKNWLLAGTIASNQEHRNRIIGRILQHEGCVGILGLAFKPGTDDLRQSPLLEMAKLLAAHGREVVVWDRHIPIPILRSKLKEAMVVASYREVLETSAVLVINDLPTEDREIRTLVKGKPHYNFSGRAL